ncbi:MAG: high-potential iron-sulfur protein [Proteobacteria bacterium]|jgi:hypothetical protein|nr:high-potential iron-sulfur protein [Pseudomonadota bacterium]MDA0847466.1 high-potential iron-sulfur protein [Pseudomonadota bacterium]
MNSRRTFVIHSAVGLGLIGSGLAAQAQAVVAETDPAAAAIGYKVNASKVDKAKYPKYAAGQNCANCALYKKVSDKAGGCTVFAGKQVAAAGWCSAWVKA